MNYVMYIQNGGNLGHAEFEEYAQAYSAMKMLAARHAGMTNALMLDQMMDENGNGPFFCVHRDYAYVDAQGEMGSLAIRIEEVENPLHAFAELQIEKTGICLKLMDQFYTVMDECLEKLPEIEMEPVEVLTKIASLAGIYDSMKTIDIALDEEAEKTYQKLSRILKYHVGGEE